MDEKDKLFKHVKVRRELQFLSFQTFDAHWTTVPQKLQKQKTFSMTIFCGYVEALFS